MPVASSAPPAIKPFVYVAAAISALGGMLFGYDIGVISGAILWIGSFAAALGGLDTLVFAGGIGENAPVVRARICEGLGFLGVELSEARNAVTPGVISSAESRVTVRVIHTEEDLMIARSVYRIPGLGMACASRPIGVQRFLIQE